MSENATLPDGRQVESLKVLELKKELEVLGLNKYGLKKDLVRRLSEVLSDPSHTQSASIEQSVKIGSDEMISTETENLKNSPTESDLKPDQTFESNANLELDSIENDTKQDEAMSEKKKVPSLMEVETIELAEKDIAEPTVQEDTAVSQSEVANFPAADLSTPDGLTPVDEVAVELHEEEEDYGDEEEEIEKNEVSKEVGKKAAADLVLEATSLGVVESIASASRKSTPPPSSLDPLATAPRRETRGIGFTVEAPERVVPAADAKCPVSRLVYIRYLVRPFTAGQLATMVEAHFGRASELWLDRIKSTAVARFSDESIATKCREGLDGCRWPSINPRILQCEFASESLFSWLKEHGEAGDKHPPRHLFSGSSAPNAASANEVNDGDADQKRTEKLNDDSQSSSAAKQRRLLGSDNTKETLKDGGLEVKQEAKGDESSKSLDDLFKKTVATPSIYWLPLTDKAASVQMKARKQTYMAESLRRPVPKRNVAERRRENRSPFTEEFGNAPASTSNPLLIPGASTKEKRPRDRTPSPNKRLPHERRRSPSPRRPRYANRTPSPQFKVSSFSAASTITTNAPRRPLSPSSPSSRYRRRTPPRR